MIRYLRRLDAPLGALLLLIVAMPLVVGVHVAAQGRTFLSRVEAVRIDVLVTNGGQPVLGLQAGDFDIHDNGVSQTADLVTFEEIPLNVVLALDMSGSLVGARAELSKAGHAVVDALRPRDKAALVTFNGAVTVAAPLAEDPTGVRAALDQPQPSGDTSLVDASYAAIVMAESDTARGLVIVFSDGQDTGSFLLADNVLATAKRTDTVVYAVSEPPPVEPLRGGRVPKFLGDLSEFTGGRVLEPGAANLGSTFLTIFNEFRQRYLISYTPRGVSTNGWHRVEVKLKGKRGTIRARPGYLAAG